MAILYEVYIGLDKPRPSNPEGIVDSRNDVRRAFCRVFPPRVMLVVRHIALRPPGRRLSFRQLTQRIVFVDWVIPERLTQIRSRLLAQRVVAEPLGRGWVVVAVARYYSGK